MLTEFINYLKDDDGETSTEYILLVAVVAMKLIVLKFKSTLNTKLNSVMNTVFEKLRTRLLTGFKCDSLSSVLWFFTFFATFFLK